MANEEFKSHKGHRARVRAKFALKGGEAFEDYEILEQILYYVFPRGDTKPLAKSLLSRYGHLKYVFAAPFPELAAHPGMNEHAAHCLKLIRTAALQCLTDNLIEAPLQLDNLKALQDYFAARMGAEVNEVFDIVCLDSELRLLPGGIMRVSDGTPDFVNIDTRRIVELALRSGASALILAHNHPYGPSTPSEDDLALTDSISAACRAIGVSLLDHIIIGEDYYSFRAGGRLEVLYDMDSQTARAAKPRHRVYRI